jgi:carboxymethylenebutenolidase
MAVRVLDLAAAISLYERQIKPEDVAQITAPLFI